jgi:hypothetical protein
MNNLRIDFFLRRTCVLKLKLVENDVAISRGWSRIVDDSILECCPAGLWRHRGHEPLRRRPADRIRVAPRYGLAVAGSEGGGCTRAGCQHPSGQWRPRGSYGRLAAVRPGQSMMAGAGCPVGGSGWALAGYTFCGQIWQPGGTYGHLDAACHRRLPGSRRRLLAA